MNPRLLFFALVVCAVLPAQPVGTITGKVTLEATGDLLHHATVLAVQLGRTAETGDDGVFVFANVPPGRYDVVAHMHSLSDLRKSVTVTAGGAASVDFSLRMSPIKQEVTVTASLREETTLETFSSVTAVDSLELVEKQGASLGEVLDKETGVAKRSSGPGTGRPVLRGFDGDRVMILQDGMPTGTISSQSGDHGEPVNPYSLEQVEVVRGPATLLYGTNAIGGVVNMVTGHHQIHQHPHEGFRGYVTATGGSNNALGGGSGGFEYGYKKWLFYGDGGGQRTGDYGSAIGQVINSGTRSSNGMAGIAHYAQRGFFNFGYGIQDGSYQIPYNSALAEDRTSLDFRRHNVRLTTGISNLGSALENFTLALNYSNWNHKEIPGDVVENEFFNKQFSSRGVFEQKKRGRMTGSFGFWGLHRDYKSVGPEALAPPTSQGALAGFAVEQFQFEKFRVQLGGRVENNRYSPDGLRSRGFTGFSGAAGLSVPTWKGGVLVANYSHSYRAPALEELYNHGPHFGNLTFEIGNPNLMREMSDGIDLAVRHQSTRVHAEANYFFYRLHDFVYLAPTGAYQDGLIEAKYSQADTRFQGVEGKLNLSLRSNLWLNLGLDSVRADIRPENTPLPRIPPVRGRAGFDLRWRSFSLMPELILANRQSRIFPTETQTAGYGLFNLRGGYNYTSKHVMHFFSVNFFNAGNSLYRNHLSFIKDFAPEIGRGVQFSYSMRFF